VTEISALPPDPIPPTETQALVAEVVEEIGPVVGIIMSSASDEETMARAGEVLTQAEVAFETRVMSAHREPDVVAEYCRGARARGLRVIIAGAGLSAALPGVAAAHTDLPVIGVPLMNGTSALGGMDALLSVAQMPPGVPVATVGLDNARNAAHLAVRILGA
jgi:phosphoribosylaminoimidazole carboxylase PurE protein